MGKVKAPAPKAKKYMTVEELALTIDREHKKKHFIEVKLISTTCRKRD
jgi:hypothetical protein